jgi:hypothetical protein
MVSAADLWDRFRSAQFWWMHAMVGLWAIFAIGLFIVEPFILARHLHRWAATRPATAFAWLAGVHWLLLVLGLITVFGAVAGSQGWSVF